MINFYWLILGILSVWRITHLLYAEDGPWQLFSKFRSLIAKGFFRSLFNCFNCLSLWVSAPVAFFLAYEWGKRFLFWLSLSAGSILIERIIERLETPPVAPYYEDKEENHLENEDVK